jgi:hypothetical protein
MANYEERRDTRFFAATQTALKDIHEQAMQLPLDQRYAAAYGILIGYVRSLTVNFAEHFSPEQLGEIGIVLGQLNKLVGEDTNLDAGAKIALDRHAQALRETEGTL